MPLERGDYESAPKWIWADNDNALTNATPGKHFFRFNFDLKGKPKAATLFITAKDNVAAWVNGKQVVVESPMGNFGRARDPWGYFRVIPVGKLLSAGANSLAAEAIVQKDHDALRRLASSPCCGSRWPMAKSTIHFRTRLESRT